MALGLGASLGIALVATIGIIALSVMFNDSMKSLYDVLRTARGLAYLVLGSLSAIVFISTGNMALMVLGLILVFFLVTYFLFDYYSPWSAASRRF
ncbi:hypothetical protein N0B31_10225 [Salinirubellus salinus]|uniref:Uncharacterized protein n=1 Tax=Salinirubellus salinus TaxID=1364945 RepID=A0A9E7R715_9EURY|nr:hypothetical protein [Salinirubellus salinus]UWM56651.1 hypothetical protein N0B31_10225 [Salinirubellus salinus]